MVFSGGEDFLFEWGMIEDFELLSVLVCCPLLGINQSVHMTACLLFFLDSAVCGGMVCEIVVH